MRRGSLEWEQLVDEITAVLVEVAAQRAGHPHPGLITYRALTRRLSTPLPYHEGPLPHLLADVSRRQGETGAPLLSALVVLEETGEPGAGFFTLAAELGRTVPSDQAGRQAA